MAFVGWVAGRYDISYKELLDNLGFTRVYDTKAKPEDILKEAEKIRKELWKDEGSF